MKKNISINISGIIFHIEEDGYDTLKKYLDSINKYFSTFEDSSEILADIESRIAEIFLSKLNEEKQVITLEDVNSLISTMGSVSDFRAAEAVEADAPSDNASQSSSANESKTGNAGENYTSFNPSKQLMRDQKRKILGGVCAGLGNYFNIDPLWIRLLFALLFFVYGITFFIYVAMWIVVPGSWDLDDPVTGKKMFRDPERKIIGGVSGGIAAFLGIDIVAVRVLFILFTIIGGLGLFIYIVMWIILPEARTLTDRVQMQGEPVTLSNIESTIKKNQIDSTADESTLTRILLFPFRLIGMILSALGRLIGPLVDIIRVAIGVVMVIIGMGFIFSIFVTGGVVFGILSAATFSVPWVVGMSEASMPFDAMMRAFPGWIAVAGFIAAVVPSIFIVLLGVSVIAKRIVFNATAGWTLFALFFISSAMLAVGIPKIVFSFKEEGEFRVENTYQITGKTAVLKINEVGMDDYDETRLTLRGHDGKDFKLVQDFEAQGTTRAKAIENAKMVDYTVEFRDDSVLIFDSNLRFKADAIFRAQRLDMMLYIPYNFPFRMDQGIARFITQYVDCCGSVGTNYIDRFTWKITEEDGLTCIDCPVEENEDESLSLSLSDFDEIDITGKFDVRISKGDRYDVEVIGSKREKDRRGRYDIYRLGETLVIKYESSHGRKFDLKDLPKLNVDEVRINITTPSLEKIEATGFGTIRFDDFTSNKMEIEATGPVKIKGNVNANYLNVDLTGKAEADLSGDVNKLDARLEFASVLRAYSLQANDAFIEVIGASSAKVSVTNNLEIEKGVASKVDYRGNPNVIIRD